MSAHESFEQLCALAVIGDLEPEEFRLLGEHLYECTSCQASYRDFHAIMDRGFPALEPRRKSGWSLRRFGMKRRFAARAGKEDIPIGRSNRRQSGILRILAPATASMLAATMLSFLLVGLMGYGWRMYRAAQDRQTQAASRIATLSDKVAELEIRLSQRREPAANPIERRPAADRERELGTQLSLLRQDYAAVKAGRSHLEERVTTLSGALEQLRADSQMSRDEVERLQRNLRDSQATLSRANLDLELLRSRSSTDASTIARQRARIDELAAKIRQQALTVDRDRDLLAADKDIRDLMGARNLRIIDVQDEGTPGKVRPLAGRIFYTKDKRLIFYAYDLQNKGSVNKVAFQVWGKKEGRSQPPHSLGILYVDNSTQNRWVLKFEDPEVLAQIDQVFVTVEPPGGSQQPTGKQLLAAAFLNESPNHP